MHQVTRKKRRRYGGKNTRYHVSMTSKQGIPIHRYVRIVNTGPTVPTVPTVSVVKRTNLTNGSKKKVRFFNTVNAKNITKSNTKKNYIRLVSPTTGLSLHLPKRISYGTEGNASPWSTQEEIGELEKEGEARKERKKELDYMINLTIGGMISTALEDFPKGTRSERLIKQKIRKYFEKVAEYDNRNVSEKENVEYLDKIRTKMIKFKPDTMTTEEYYRFIDEFTAKLHEFRNRIRREWWNLEIGYQNTIPLMQQLIPSQEKRRKAANNNKKYAPPERRLIEGSENSTSPVYEILSDEPLSSFEQMLDNTSKEQELNNNDNNDNNMNNIRVNHSTKHMGLFNKKSAKTQL